MIDRVSFLEKRAHLRINPDNEVTAEGKIYIFVRELAPQFIQNPAHERNNGNPRELPQRIEKKKNT